jgi:AcrR family transcriptional regulator
MKTGHAPLAPRKIPVQSRGRERVERILDAAAQVFAEVGYDAATTDAIATQAGASIGSLYQFYPNKQAIFDAVARRHLDRASELFDALLAAADERTSWLEILDGAIDGFAALDRSDPSLRAVWRNWHVAASFVTAGSALNREFARRTEGVVARYARRVPRAKREIVATMVVEVISSMLLVVARSRGASAQAILDETKVMLRRYLEPYVRPRSSRTRAAPREGTR